MSRRIHIRMWMLVISFLLLAVACSSSDDTEGTEKRQAMLTVYVYSPEHPLLIRSDVGNVNASAAESKITRLQIWIFENGTGNKVAYLDTQETSLLSVGEGAVYQIPVSDEFARNKPDVDVFVMANIPSDGFGGGNTLDATSTREQVRTADIPEGRFGLSSPTKVVPDEGLPMTGALTAQPVVGDAPVLRIGTLTNIATVQLVRAVSKVRFVFANTKSTTDDSAPPLYIKGITMDADKIPQQEYLIPPRTAPTLAYYTAEKALFLAANETEYVTAAETENPTLFIFGGQEAQEYEDLLDEYISKDPAELTQIGPYYLKESDRQLSGKISYQIGSTSKEPMAFRMEHEGDFRRNHTWIVYAYYVGGNYLQLSAIYVKDWNTTNTKNHDVYNW